MTKNTYPLFSNKETPSKNRFLSEDDNASSKNKSSNENTYPFLSKIKSNNYRYANSSEVTVNTNYNEIYNNNFNNKSVLLPATVYIIIPCSDEYVFEKDYINLIPYYDRNIEIVNSELNEIKVKNTNHYREHLYRIYNEHCEILDTFGGKNIFLYKADLLFNTQQEKFNIELIYYNEPLISKSDYTVQQGQQKFICCENFQFKSRSTKYKHWVYNNYKPNDLINFIDNKYKISDLQKFVIFKLYLKFNSMEKYVPNLLNHYSETIDKQDKIEVEFIFDFIYSLFNDKKSFTKLSLNSQESFKTALKSLKHMKTIYYNNNLNKEKYKGVLNILEENYSYYDDELSLYVDLLQLMIINMNKNVEKFNMIFNRIKMKEKAADFIINHKNCYSNFHSPYLVFLFKYATNKDRKFNDILSLASNFNEYLNFFCLNGNYIINKKIKLDLSNIPVIDESTEIDLLNPFFEILDYLRVEWGYKQKICIGLSNLINIYYKKDLKKLYVLREIFRKNYSNNDILKKINYAIHDTGKISIMNNELSNIEIIKFIKEDARYYPNSYNNINNEYTNLISYIKLDKVDDKFCYEFNTSKYNTSNDYYYDYKQLFKNNYDLFIESIINCAKTFTDFKILYNIFNIEYKIKFFNIYSNKMPKGNIFPIIDLLIEHIYNVDKNGITTEELGNVFGPLFKFISDYDNHSLNRLFEVISRKFSSKDINEMFAYILVSQDGKLKYDIMEKLVKNMKELSNDNVISFLNQFENKRIFKELLLQKLDNKIVSEKEIFSEELTDNLKTLRTLINMNYFKYKLNALYIKKTRENMNNLMYGLNGLEFKMNQLKIMQLINKPNKDGKNILKSRLFLICLGNQSSADRIYHLLNEKIDYCIEIYNKIDKVIKTIGYYYPNDKKEKIKFYKKVKDNILENPIKEFPRMEDLEPNELEELYETTQKISGFKDSKFFIEIFESNKKNSLRSASDSTILEKTKEEFFNLKKLFDVSTEDEVDIDFLERIIGKINNNEMENEIKILLNIFEISQAPKNNICNKLILLNNKKNTTKLLKNNIMLLTDFKLKEYIILNNIKEILQKLQNQPSLIIISESYEDLNKLNLKIFDPTIKFRFSAIINEMYDKPELMEFIIDKKYEDIQQMSEFIDDIEDLYITLADIGKLESCLTFVQDIKCYNKHDENIFLNGFIKTMKKDKYRDIGIKFKDVSGKYADFHELYTNHLNPNELNKVHIESIFKESTFGVQHSVSEYRCNVEYANNSKFCTKKFDEMLDLRETALLRKKDQKKGYFEICEGFANIINRLQEILVLLNTIDSKGYPEPINYTIDVRNGNALAYRKGINRQNGRSLEEIIEELKMINEIQYNELEKTYLESPISRMIYGKQFTYINSRNKNDVTSKYILKNILKYITGNNFKYDIGRIENRSLEKSSLRQMYKNVNNYLIGLFDINNINMKSVFKNSILIGNSIRGIYTHSSTEDEIEYDAICCSLSLTKNFPIGQTVLYCNKDTTEDELISFIYRSLHCIFNALFILIKPENLGIEMKNLLVDLLKNHYSQEEMKSCLLIQYTKECRTKEIITEIEKISYYKYTDIKLKKEDNTTKQFPNVDIYSSDISGLGKSTLIKKDFQRSLGENYEYVYFPVGDHIDQQEILERLMKLTDKRVALHLDLSNTKQIELLREFLFSFIILKCYSKHENIFYYGNEIRIKVEIPNGFINFKSLFPIFNFFNNINIVSFNNRNIDSNNIAPSPLMVPNDITSNIQVVCNYLNNINNINKKDIYIDGKEEDLKKKGIVKKKYDAKFHIKAVPLSQDTCHTLIFQYLNIENPNYYQIESFIKIVAGQLKLLTNSWYLNAEQLDFVYNNYHKNPYLYKARKFFIESLLKITKYFITSSYDDIIKGQNITYEQQQGKLDLEKASQKANELLTNKKTFSFKDIKPSMILINEDEQSISEIGTCDTNTEERKILEALFNSDKTKITNDIPNYKQMTPEEFLVEVRKVLDLYNKLDKNDPNGVEVYKGKKLEYLKDIVDNYVFTEDNFVKLILISLRLRANVPVVLMGETGAGKTSLLKIIAKLKGITLHVKNIHAGIEDNDIIQFLNDKQLFENHDEKGKGKEKEEEKEEEVWVFLDEINTCNSLGLINEIMLKHSCKGKKMKSNIKFIAACNPYRLDTGKKEIIGLYDETKHMDRHLVYNVYPLPHSLLNYVLDFKTPDGNDIKRYISNITLKTLNKLIPNQSS